MPWNPHSPRDWARLLGLVAVPLFGRDRRDPHAGTHVLLLDGALSSLVYSLGNASDLLPSALPAQWAWSANVNHAVVIDRNLGVLSAVRWDRPHEVREHQISSASDAQQLLSTFANDQPEATATAINRTLGIFRSLRRNLSEYRGTDLDAIRALNVLLLLADAIHRGILPDSPTTLEEAVGFLNRREAISYTPSDFSSSAAPFPLGDLAGQLLEDYNGLILDPYLLIRHASGALFQQAHDFLETSPERHLFVSLHKKPPKAKKGTKRDTRYTPTTLARFLTESAVHEFTKLNPRATAVDILDPACGSGVFLVEATRTLRNVTSIHLRGMDSSPKSTVIADFAVRQAARSLADDVATIIDIKQADSLAEHDWGSPDVILMNPPFLSWRVIDKTTKASIKATLGDLYEGQSDTAIAFVARAVEQLRPGAVLATIIPDSFLDSRAARRLRTAIAQDPALSVRLIGRFRGFSYFTDAAVEPAFLLISRSSHNGSQVRTVIADASHEERAIQTIRRLGHSGEHSDAGYEIRFQPYDMLQSTDWTPRSSRAMATINRWRSDGMRPVTELFDIHLGIRVGAKPVFVVSEDELRNVTAREAQYFRPVADEIRNGQIVRRNFVFYPYRQGTLLLESERDLERAVPWFYGVRLHPKKEELAARKSQRNRQWWELVEPRPTWMDAASPRILSPTYGCCGTFAYDDQAQYAVVQGSAWLWRLAVRDVDLILAYLALFNSYEFESLLNLLCRRVGGGQYELRNHYLRNVPVPDLSRADADVRRRLADQGRQIQAGDGFDPRDICESVSRAYGVDPTVFSGDFPRGKLGTLQNRFDMLARQWRDACGHTSKLSTMITAPAYEQIIGMGMDAVPLILRELRRQPNHWFTALEQVTGANPVDTINRGKLGMMTRAWLEWGRESHSF